MRVGDYTGVLPNLEADSTVKKAASLFKKTGSDRIVIVKESRPVGVLSAFEVLEKIVEDARLEDIPVKQLMNHNILVIDADTNQKDAADTMLTHKHWMAIVTENGEYRGVVTVAGLLKELLS